MAGLGRRTFAAGEVLTASNVMGYLQDQAVMNFAGTAARGSAVPTPSEGMVSYLADSNVVQAYDGAAWNSLAYATAVPTNAQVGLKPVIPSSVSVAAGTASYNSTTGLVTFTNAQTIRLEDVFTSTYKSYRVVINIDSTGSNTELGLRMRNSGSDYTGANYFQGGRREIFSGTTNAYSTGSATLYYLHHISTDANRTTIFSMDIGYPNVATSTVFTGSGFGNFYNTGPTGYVSSGILLTTTQYTALSVFGAADGTNLTGTLKVYGYN